MYASYLLKAGNLINILIILQPAFTSVASKSIHALAIVVAQCVGDIKAYQRLYTPYGSPLIDHRAICIWQRHVTLPYAYGTVVN